MSIVEILHFSIFLVVSMETLIEEASDIYSFNFFCHFYEWWAQLQLLTNLHRDLRHLFKIDTG